MTLNLSVDLSVTDSFMESDFPNTGTVLNEGKICLILTIIFS